MKDGRIAIRIDRKLKRKALKFRINISQCCTSAIRQEVIARERDQPSLIVYDDILDRRDAAVIFNRLLPIWRGIQKDPDALAALARADQRIPILRDLLSEVPDKYLRDFSVLLTGGEPSEFVIGEFFGGLE